MITESPTFYTVPHSAPIFPSLCEILKCVLAKQEHSSQNYCDNTLSSQPLVILPNSTILANFCHYKNNIHQDSPLHALHCITYNELPNHIIKLHAIEKQKNTVKDPIIRYHKVFRGLQIQEALTMIEAGQISQIEELLRIKDVCRLFSFEDDLKALGIELKRFKSGNLLLVNPHLQNHMSQAVNEYYDYMMDLNLLKSGNYQEQYLHDFIVALEYIQGLQEKKDKKLHPLFKGKRLWFCNKILSNIDLKLLHPQIIVIFPTLALPHFKDSIKILYDNLFARQSFQNRGCIIFRGSIPQLSNKNRNQNQNKSIDRVKKVEQEANYYNLYFLKEIAVQNKDVVQIKEPSIFERYLNKLFSYTLQAEDPICTLNSASTTQVKESAQKIKTIYLESCDTQLHEINTILSFIRAEKYLEKDDKNLLIVCQSVEMLSFLEDAIKREFLLSNCNFRNAVDSCESSKIYSIVPRLLINSYEVKIFVAILDYFDTSAKMKERGKELLNIFFRPKTIFYVHYSEAIHWFKVNYLHFSSYTERKLYSLISKAKHDLSLNNPSVIEKNDAVGVEERICGQKIEKRKIFLELLEDLISKIHEFQQYVQCNESLEGIFNFQLDILSCLLGYEDQEKLLEQSAGFSIVKNYICEINEIDPIKSYKLKEYSEIVRNLCYFQNPNDRKHHTNFSYGKGKILLCMISDIHYILDWDDVIITECTERNFVNSYSLHSYISNDLKNLHYQAYRALHNSVYGVNEVLGHKERSIVQNLNNFLYFFCNAEKLFCTYSSYNRGKKQEKNRVLELLRSKIKQYSNNHYSMKNACDVKEKANKQEDDVISLYRLLENQHATLAQKSIQKSISINVKKTQCSKDIRNKNHFYANQYITHQDITQNSLQEKMQFTSTMLEKLLQNPYCFYIEYILKLKSSSPTNNANNAFFHREFGIMTHSIINSLIRQNAFQLNMQQYLVLVNRLFIKEARKNNVDSDSSIFILWKLRSMRIYRNIFKRYKGFSNREVLAEKYLKSEVSLMGEVQGKKNDTLAKLQARVDAIEYRMQLNSSDSKQGIAVELVDYKTGAALPKIQDLVLGIKPQLAIYSFLWHNAMYCNRDCSLGSDLQDNNFKITYLHLNHKESDNIKECRFVFDNHLVELELQKIFAFLENNNFAYIAFDLFYDRAMLHLSRQSHSISIKR